MEERKVGPSKLHPLARSDLARGMRAPGHGPVVSLPISRGDGRRGATGPDQTIACVADFLIFFRDGSLPTVFGFDSC